MSESESRVEEILSLLMEKDTRHEDIAALLTELGSMRHLAVPKLLEMLTREPPVRNDTIPFLLSLLGNAELVPELVKLIHDEAVSDDLKLDLIAVIVHLEPDIDVDTLLRHVKDARGTILRSQREYVRGLRTPTDLMLLMEVIEERMPSYARTNFVRSFIELDEPAAVPLLACMCYDPDPSVALTAIDAVERFKDARALPALDELGTHHPHPEIREEARKAADRLRIRASLTPQAEPIAIGPVHSCYLSTIDGDGTQVALIARRQTDETLKVANVMFDDQDGILDSFSGSISPDGFAQMLNDINSQGREMVSVSHAQLVEAIELGREATWRAGYILPMAFVALLPMFERGLDRSTARLPIPEDKRTELFKNCYELLLQEEFFSWQIEADSLVERYMAMRDGDNLPPAEALLALLQEGVRDTVDDHLRRLIRGRLRRMAPLLREIYDEEEAWQWAVVAADALDDDSPIAPEDHPLLLGMVACGLENALDEEIYWLDLF